jgi:hypothetical protein
MRPKTMRISSNVTWPLPSGHSLISCIPLALYVSRKVVTQCFVIHKIGIIHIPLFRYPSQPCLLHRQLSTSRASHAGIISAHPSARIHATKTPRTLTPASQRRHSLPSPASPTPPHQWASDRHSLSPPHCLRVDHDHDPHPHSRSRLPQHQSSSCNPCLPEEAQRS